MKTVLSCLLAIFIASSLNAASFKVGPINYVIETDSTVYVNGLEPLEELREVTIPAIVSFEGTTYKVIGVESCRAENAVSIMLPSTIEWIGDGAFWRCRLLYSVVIPDNCVEIGKYAFEDCSQLKVLQLGKKVKRIGQEAFANNPRLSSVKLNTCLESIGNKAFSDCKALTAIHLSDSIVTLGANAFSHCTALVDINMSDRLREIGEGCFSDCINLKTVHLGNNIQIIGARAFENCQSLYSINFPKNLKKIGQYTFSGCTSLDTIQIPDGVTVIEEGAFMGCGNLYNVSVGKNTYKIGKCTFKNCTKLYRCTLSARLRSIEPECFSGCSSLTTITIPDKVTIIGNDAFYQCSKLSSVVMGEKVERIGESAFKNCFSLKNVSLKNVELIESDAFNNCVALDSIYIPKTIISIGDNDNHNDWKWMKNVFAGCTNVKSIIVDKDNPVFTSLNNANAIYQQKNVRYDGKKDVEFSPLRNLILITGCQNTQMPCEGLGTIGSYAFVGVPIKSITIPNGVQDISTGAFADCKELDSVTLPATLQNIGARTFENCMNLTTIISYAPEPFRFWNDEENNSFKNIDPATITISVLEESEERYFKTFDGYNFNILINNNPDSLQQKEAEEAEPIYVVVEHMPEFVGGQLAMFQFIDEHMQYPVAAQQKGIQGRVICQCVINKDGSISDVKVVRSVGDASLDNEAIRIISCMPNWLPGKSSGETRRVAYTIPIDFRL